MGVSHDFTSGSGKFWAIYGRSGGPGTGGRRLRGYRGSDRGQIEHPHEHEALRRRGGAGALPRARPQDAQNVLRRPAAAADLHQGADDVPDHVAEEAGPGHLIAQVARRALVVGERSTAGGAGRRSARRLPRPGTRRSRARRPAAPPRAAIAADIQRAAGRARPGAGRTGPDRRRAPSCSGRPWRARDGARRSPAPRRRSPSPRGRRRAAAR